MRERQDGEQRLPEGQTNPWKRRARRTVYQNPWIMVYEDGVTRPDGQPGIYGVVHFRNRAVGIVALDVADRVLLVGQYRYTLDQYSWEIPEGGAPLDEEPLAAARRELQEETGFSARQWQEIGRAHLSNSVTDEEAIFYLARDLHSGEATPEPTELLATQWVPFVDALQMVTDRHITDALTILALQRVALMRQGC